MSDAGEGEDEGTEYEGGYDFGMGLTPNANKSSPPPGPENQGPGDPSYTGNFDYGAITGGTAPASMSEGGADVAAPEIQKPEPATEPEKKEEKPIITRGRRRRSILTELEGGFLQQQPVHRRSILGR